MSPAQGADATVEDVVEVGRGRAGRVQELLGEQWLALTPPVDEAGLLVSDVGTEETQLQGAVLQ